MANHLSILAWRTPCTKEPGGLQSIGSQKSQFSIHACTIVKSISYKPMLILVYQWSSDTYLYCFNMFLQNQCFIFDLFLLDLLYFVIWIFCDIGNCTLFYNIVFLYSIRGSDHVEFGKDTNSVKLLWQFLMMPITEKFTPHFTPHAVQSDFLYFHQLRRASNSILHSSHVNVLLHVSDRKFSSINRVVSFIDPFPYLLLWNPLTSTNTWSYYWTVMCIFYIC